VLFFVSVGMLFDPQALAMHPLGFRVVEALQALRRTPIAAPAADREQGPHEPSDRA
jgi:predicted Kef-type K+ transport protein